MLPKALRLTKPQEFSLIYKKGKRLFSTNLRLFYITVKRNQNNTRFGFVVSKKQAQKIVVRNRVKRILRGHILKLKGQILPGFDAVFQGRPGIIRTKRQTIREELEYLLKKAGIVKI